MDNIVKRVCKELNITQKELAERLGVNNGTVRQWSSQKEPPQWAVNFMNLLIENKNISSKLELFQKAFEMIDKARS